MFAEWLNSAFASFDYSILEFFHHLAESAGFILTPISKFLGFIGSLGYVGFLFITAILLLFFQKTRKCGICMILAIAIGALITNLLIKNIVARPRPYNSEIAAFKEWWQYAGAQKVSEFSFPSGHSTSTMAALLALWLAASKKHKAWLAAPCLIFVLAMGASRNYLMVHYPTDVIAGFITGAIAAAIAALTVNFLQKKTEAKKDKKFCAFLLNSDVRSLFKKRSTSSRDKNTQKNTKVVADTHNEEDFEID